MIIRNFYEYPGGVITAYVIEDGPIVLEVIENARYGAVVVIRRKRLKADVVQPDGNDSAIIRRIVANNVHDVILKIKNLKRKPISLNIL